MTPAEKETMAGRVGYTVESLDKIMVTKFDKLGEEWVREGEKMRVSMENLQYQIGRFIGPIVINLLTKIANELANFAEMLTGEKGPSIQNWRTMSEAEKEQYAARFGVSAEEFNKIITPLRTDERTERLRQWKENQEQQQRISWERMKKTLGLSKKTLSSRFLQKAGLDLESFVVPEEFWQNMQSQTAAWQKERYKKRHPPINVNVNLTTQPGESAEILTDKITMKIRGQLRTELQKIKLQDTIANSYRRGD